MIYGGYLLYKVYDLVAGAGESGGNGRIVQMLQQTARVQVLQDRYGSEKKVKM